ncbi:MAG TPA: Gfo/Idh/MocA family oxidoreductase [Candidatus Hydrogenedentes bacterium]|nr:Gfo/Idh/MocA family oxidoreductase [Candidatus Hydrogenedentota bacterium]
MITEDTGKTISRRGFLGAAAAFSIMAKHTALGSEANSKVRAGIVGLGGRGRMIAGMAQNHGGYQITAVADYFPDIAQGVGEWLSVSPENRFSGLHGYLRLLESGVDAMFLETPPFCFPEHAKASVEKGCHVFMAKPVACDVPGTMTVLEAGRKAGANGRVFLVDFQTRTDPFFIEGIRRLHRGDIGRVGMLSSIYTDESFPDPPLTDTIESRLRHLIWVNDDDLGGGYLVNAGIHAIDVALWMAGDTPVSAMGSSRIVRNDPHGDSHDVYSLTYQFKDGLILNHRGEHLKNEHGFKCECIAFGQTGYLEAGYSSHVRLHGGVEPYEGGQVVDLYPQGAIRNIETFHESIVNGVYDNPTLEPSINANLAVILGREAAAKKTSMTWDELMRENRKIEVDTTGLAL